MGIVGLGWAWVEGRLGRVEVRERAKWACGPGYGLRTGRRPLPPEEADSCFRRRWPRCYG